MESSRNDFPYRPLPPKGEWIRIIHLLPGTFDDPIHCELEHASLGNKPTYIALSYAWGDPSVTVPIFLKYRPPTTDSTTERAIDGHNNQEFQVTVNLESGLRYLRCKKQAGTFWIDAICINQRDLDERGLQVKNMGNLYAAATRVHVWLGPPTGTDAWGLDPAMLKDAIPRLLPMIEHEMRRFGCGAHDIAQRNPNFHLNSGEIQWTLNIACRSWWKRMWVLQEACLAPTPVELQLGPTSFSFNRYYFLLLACIGLFEKQSASLGIPRVLDPLHFRAAMGRHRSLPSEMPPAYQLLLLLQSTSGQYESSEPRDRVLGLLGMLSDRTETRKIVSYTTPLAQFFRDVALYLLTATGSLSILWFCPPKINTLPSWVPDWTSVVLVNIPSTVSEDSWFSLSTCQRQLLIRAVPGGVVTLSYKMGDMKGRPLEQMRYELRELERKIREATEPQGDPSSIIKTIGKMIIRYQWDFNGEDVTLLSMALSVLIGDSEWPGQLAEVGITTHFAARVEAAVRRLQYAILVVTSTGLAGILHGSQVHADGSHVYVPPDSPLALVLRKRNEHQYCIVNTLHMDGYIDTADGSLLKSSSLEEITLV
jgi:hypothetical protein